MKSNNENQFSKVLLLCAFLKGQINQESKLEELSNLAHACNLSVELTIWQNLERRNLKHYVGKGKLEEVKQALVEHEIEIVVCNTELTPSQLVYLEQELECTIFDRTYLILEIFSKRARTQEAKLQVKIANLAYQLPRLVGLRSSLSRQAGGMQNKGLGETKLELDRRVIRSQMITAQKQLDHLLLQKIEQKKQRTQNDVFTVALVGYTNAGKSTLMNKVLEVCNVDKDKQVMSQDMLFATLQTTSRRVHIEGNSPFILTDTVGFVSDLPTHLIKAFRSTLMEILDADLLLHVVDVSDDEFDFQMQTTLNTLSTLKADNIPVLTVYNKIDLGIKSDFSFTRDDFLISCKSGEGIVPLLKRIQKIMTNDLVLLNVFIPYSDSHIYGLLKKDQHIVSETTTDYGYELSVYVMPSLVNKLKKYLKT